MIKQEKHAGKPDVEKVWFNMKKMIGIAAFLIALGMLFMLLISNRILGLIMIGLLIFAGYNCYGKF